MRSAADPIPSPVMGQHEPDSSFSEPRGGDESPTEVMAGQSTYGRGRVVDYLPGTPRSAVPLPAEDDGELGGPPVTVMIADLPKVRAESVLTKVARFTQIIVNLIIIAVAVFVLYLIVSHNSSVPGIQPAATQKQPIGGENGPFPCDNPTTDKYGTYCPESPGD